MRFYSFCFTISLLLLSSFNLAGQQLDYIPGQVIVQFKETIKTDQKAAIVAGKYNNKYSVNKALFPGMGIYLLEFNPNQHALDDVLTELNKDRDVIGAQGNSLVEPRNNEPDDPFYPEQWYLETIQAAEAWDVTTGGKDINGREIVLAVLDRGFDINHEDLLQNVWTNNDEIPFDGIDNDGNGFIDDHLGWNFLLRSDRHGLNTGEMNHGTTVAGIAGARGNNDTGISGAIWDVKIMFVSGMRSEAEIIEGYRYVSETRKRYNETNGQEGAYVVVTSLSVGIREAFAGDHPVWCNLYNELGQQGILSVCATDNLESDVEMNGDMPTTCTSEYMIAVTNTDRNNRKTPVAAYGVQSIDMGAPAVESLTTSPNSNYITDSGTSLAAPLVAGAVALLYSAPCKILADQALVNPSDLALRVKSIIYGGLNTNASLKEITSQGGVLNMRGSIEALDVSCGGENASGNSISVVKNPVFKSTDDIVVDYLAQINGDIYIRLFDTKGALVFEQKVLRSFFGENRFRINTSNLSTGMYLVSLGLPNNRNVTRKVVVH